MPHSIHVFSGARELLNFVAQPNENYRTPEFIMQNDSVLHIQTKWESREDFGYDLSHVPTSQLQMEMWSRIMAAASQIDGKS